MYTNVDDPPKLTSLSKNDRLALVYNEVVNHIARLKASGRIPEGMDLSAEGITSQIILESGWGGSRLAKESNNFGGLTAGKAWKGPVDIVENDPITGKTYNYRVFDSPLKGIQAQVEFYLPDVNSRYAKAGVLTAKNSDEHFARVKAAGYAEDANYVSKLSSFVKSTIRPRLKRGGDQEALNEWYASQDNYNNNEKFVKALETEDDNLSLNTNEVLDNQTWNAYEAKAKKDAVVASNENTLDEGTMQVLNLTDSNPESAITTNLDLGNIESTQPQIFSEETEKQNAAIAQQQLKKEMQLQQIMNASIMEDNAASFGKGTLFGADRRTGGYINRFNNGGTMYPKYFDNGDPTDLASLLGNDSDFLINKPGYGAKKTVKKFDNFIDPISFNVDAETGNKKIYNLETGKFDVTDTPYEDKGEYGVSMMSHRADRYEDNDMSPEAKAARIEKGEDMLKYSQMKSDRAMQQFADRSDYSAEEGLGLQEQGVSKGFWDTYKNQFQCISGSSSNCSPIPGMPMDKVQPNYATVPHFNKNRKGELILNTQKTAGTQKSGKDSTGPGDNIPNMGGNETFASWGTRNYGFEMTPPQSPLKEGQILVHHGYDDWKSRAAGVDNPPYKNTFQYGRVKNWGPYHAQTVGNIAKESIYGDEKEGFKIGNNPGHGKYSLADIKDVDEKVHRDVAQFNWVYDNPYYKKVLADIQKKNKLSKND